MTQIIEQVWLMESRRCKRHEKSKIKYDPSFVILFDNIDGSLNRRHMTMENQNFDYHWVNHKIVVNRVSGNKFDKSTRDILNISNHRFLPTVQDQKLHCVGGMSPC